MAKKVQAEVIFGFRGLVGLKPFRDKEQSKEIGGSEFRNEDQE